MNRSDRKVFFILFFLLLSQLRAQTFAFEEANIFESPFPGEEITTHYQDNSGNIWLFGNGKLFYFNGFFYQKISLNFHQYDQLISILKVDSLFIITTQGTLLVVNHLLDDQPITDTLNIPAPLNFHISSVYTDSILWVLTNHHFIRISGIFSPSERTVDTLLTVPDENESFLYLYSNSIPWYFSTNQSKIFRFDPVRGIADTIKLDGYNVYGLQPLRLGENDTLVAQYISSRHTMNNHLVFLIPDFSRKSVKIVHHINLKRKTFINPELTNFLIINPDLFFIWTNNQGAFFIDRSGNTINLDREKSFYANEIYSARYYPPMLVLTTPRGIIYLKNPEIRVINPTVGLSDPNVWKIIGTGDPHRLLIATSSGLDYLYPVNSLQFSLEHLPAFKDVSIYSMGFDHQNRLWVSLGDFDGLYIYGNGKTQKLQPKTEADLSLTNFFAKGINNQFYLGGSNFLYTYDYSSFQKHPLTDSLNSHSRIVSRYQMIADTLLIALFNQGAYLVNLKTNQIQLKNFPFPTSNCFFISLDQYFLTDGFMNTYFVHEGNDTLLLTNRFAGTKVYNLGWIPSKRLYFISDNLGIHFFDSTFTWVKHFHASNGLPSDETNFDAIYYDDRFFYVGTINGIALIPLDRLTDLPDLHFPVQKMLIVSDIDQSIKIPIRKEQLIYQFPYNLKNVKLQFIPNYLYSDNIFFSQAQIESDQLKLTKNGHFVVEFPNLPPGEYRVNAKFFWKHQLYTLEQIQLIIRISSPYYTRWWFILFTLLVLAFAILGIVRYRSYHLEKRARQLQEKIDQQINDIKRYQTVLEAIFNNMNEIVLVFSLDGSILFSNLREENFNVQHFRDLLKILPSASAKELSVIFTHRSTDVLRASEPIRWNEKSYTYYFGPLIVNNQLEGFIFLLINISQLLENEQLKIKLETLNQIFATFNHYINNYLQSIFLNVDLHRLHPELFNTAQAMQEIEHSSNKIRLILENMEEIIKTGDYQTTDYAGIKNTLIKLHRTEKGNPGSDDQ